MSSSEPTNMSASSTRQMSSSFPSTLTLNPKPYTLDCEQKAKELFCLLESAELASVMPAVEEMLAERYEEDDK